VPPIPFQRPDDSSDDKGIPDGAKRNRPDVLERPYGERCPGFGRRRIRKSFRGQSFALQTVAWNARFPRCAGVFRPRFASSEGGRPPDRARSDQPILSGLYYILAQSLMSA
jgi:hypothetical protein